MSASWRSQLRGTGLGRAVSSALTRPRGERVRAIAEVEETTVSDVIRDALAEHVERRRSHPEFQTMLKRNLQRHEELLSKLADG